MKNLLRTWTVYWWYGVATPQEWEGGEVQISSSYLQLLPYYSRLGCLLPSRHHKYSAQLDQKQQVTNCSWIFANTPALDTALGCSWLFCNVSVWVLGDNCFRRNNTQELTHTQEVQWASETTSSQGRKLDSGSCFVAAVVAVVAWCVNHFARRMRGQPRTCQSCKGRQDGLDISTQKSSQ